ncbi:MAG: excinuclease ABC subunit UvrC [Candidatus Melainabacteria bacterium]|nr:excinuclease ABC subunit UvrC [Candidatus Melainabacteria bacterium]
MDVQPPVTFHRETELARLTTEPGIYRMFNAQNQLIYVGKAKNLRNRVRSYFHQNAQHTPKVRSMVANIAWFDTIVTDSEREALILEDSLIKQYKPRYNICLRDDKHFPWIGLSAEPYPRLFVTRRPKRQPPEAGASSTGYRAQYFGPYTNSNHMYLVLSVIRKHFPLRQRRNALFKDRPCMNYHIGLCPGPCQQLIEDAAYAETVRQVTLFLKGRTDELLEHLEQQMLSASEQLQFERAAKLRDRHRAVASLASRQKIVSPNGDENQDIVAMVSHRSQAMATVISVRRGRIIWSRSIEVPLPFETTEAEAYGDFLFRFYPDREPDELPEELILQHPVEDAELLTDWLSERRGKRVHITQPKRGHKLELLQMAHKNAQQALEQARLYAAIKAERDPTEALIQLQETLDLPEFPERIECYDISHIQGTNTVASMVVFTGGQADKKAYRHFKIRSLAEGSPDDFQSMAEVIRRRLEHLDNWGEPNLIVIDGGKGQLNAAYGVLQQAGLTGQPIISLAKRFEEIYLPGEPIPKRLDWNNPALQLLQRLRDEAHRFAITHHRQKRGKAATKSQLDDVPGIGPQRKKKLMAHFKTVQAILQAEPGDLAQVLGISAAQAALLHQHLQATKA